jgi:hypothetical protein
VVDLGKKAAEKVRGISARLEGLKGHLNHKRGERAKKHVRGFVKRRTHGKRRKKRR